MSCALFSSVVLNPQTKTLPPIFCGNLSNLCEKQTNYSSQGASNLVPLKDGKVVLEEIFSSCDAVKLWILSSSRQSNHMTVSHCAEEETALLNLKLKTPITWDNLNDER